VGKDRYLVKGGLIKGGPESVLGGRYSGGAMRVLGGFMTHQGEGKKEHRS